MTSWKELPFKELHQEAEIKEGVDHKEKAVPESNPGVEGAEIQVIIVTDSLDDCKSEAFSCHNQLLALPPSDSHLLQAKKNQFHHFTPMHLLETPLNSHSCTSKATLHQHKLFSPSSTRNGKIFPPTTAQSNFPRNWGHKSSWNLLSLTFWDAVEQGVPQLLFPAAHSPCSHYPHRYWAASLVDLWFIEISLQYLESSWSYFKTLIKKNPKPQQTQKTLSQVG